MWQGGFASNGYGAHSPGRYSLTSCLVAEVVFTFMFLMIIMGATDLPFAGGIRGNSDRAWIDADSPDRHSGNEPLGESGAQHWSGRIRRRVGD